MGEIIIFSSIIRKSSIFLISILLASFLSALYNLHLYTSLNHGNPPIYLNPLRNYIQTHLSSLHFHFTPLILLTLKPELLL
jgi:NADH:ubiquinone oxidoreductase subunit 4 (subunit M)